MSWVLVLILFSADGSSSSYAYPTDDAPQRFDSLATCVTAGGYMTDGDGDDEHANCVPIRADEQWCSAYIVTDYATEPPTEIVAAPAGPCGPGPLWGDADSG